MAVAGFVGNVSANRGGEGPQQKGGRRRGRIFELARGPQRDDCAILEACAFAKRRGSWRRETTVSQSSVRRKDGGVWGCAHAAATAHSADSMSVTSSCNLVITCGVWRDGNADRRVANLWSVRTSTLYPSGGYYLMWGLGHLVAADWSAAPEKRQAAHCETLNPHGRLSRQCLEYRGRGLWRP